MRARQSMLRCSAMMLSGRSPGKESHPERSADMRVRCVDAVRVAFSCAFGYTIEAQSIVRVIAGQDGRRKDLPHASIRLPGTVAQCIAACAWDRS